MGYSLLNKETVTLSCGELERLLALDEESDGLADADLMITILFYAYSGDMVMCGVLILLRPSIVNLSRPFSLVYFQF